MSVDKKCSKLDELLEKLCPDGVEYKKVSEITKVLRGKRLTKSELTEKGEYPVFHGGLDPLGYYYKNNRKAETVMVINVGASAGTVGYSREDFWSSDGCYCLEQTEAANARYLFFAFQTKEHYLISRVRKAGIPTLDAKVIETMQVPVPPLEVQHEIVRILDNFSQLTAELTAELTARKKQYEFYRDKLLTATDEIPVVKLEDIATDFFRGSGIKRNEVTDEGVSCVRYGEIYTTYNTWFDKCISHTNLKYVKSPKYFEHGDILFAITGESIEDIAKSTAYLGHDKCLAGGDIVIMKHNQNPRYLAHVLSTTEAKFQKSKGKVKSKVVHSNIPSIKEIQIPLPSLEIQERYANILDNFESICTDLNSGLPAEIEARQKQYEYYRDKLLSFREKQ